MEPRRSLGWPILLGVVLIGSIIALGVGWVLVSIAAALGSENAAFYYALLGVGVALLVLVLVGVIVYLALTVKAIALSQRQSNFIDSVTHELKSPLASLKLSLQTLTRRPVPAEQQAGFHRIMLQDIERLDTLIDHLLDAAKTLQRKPRTGREAAAVEPVLRQVCAAVAQRRHGAGGVAEQSNTLFR
jgi:signal transduction histidine kinase